RIAAFDESGAPVLAIDSLSTRALEAGELRAGPAGPQSLFGVEWTPVPSGSTNGTAPRLAVAGEGLDLDAERYADVRAIGDSIETGAPVPDAVLVAVGAEPADDAQ